MWTAADDQRIEARLRELISDGQELEPAIRTLHQADGLGALFICRAVERVAGLDPHATQRLVVRALFPIWHGRLCEPEE